MAKKSWIARDKKKADTVKRYAELRTQLKAEKDYIGLTMLPRNASPTRTVNRCLVSGRRRAFIRRFKLSRISFRELANAGTRTGKAINVPKSRMVFFVPVISALFPLREWKR